MKAIVRIISFTKHLWKWYFFMGFFVVFSSLLSLVVPLLSKHIVDIIVAKTVGQPVDYTLFIILLCAVISTDIFISFFTSVGQWIGDILTVRLQTYLSQKFYAHVLNLDIQYFDNEMTGTITNKMYRGISSITEFIKSMLTNFLPFFLTAIVTVVLLSFYSPIISILLTILFPVYILISHRSTIAWERYEKEKNRLNDYSQGRVLESFIGIRVVKAFVAELTELISFLDIRKKIESLAIQQTKEWHWFDFVRRFFLNIILFCIFTYIVDRTFHGIYTIGEMTLLLQLVNQARFPLFAMSYILGQIQQAGAGSLDFFVMLDTKRSICDTKDAKPLLIADIGNPEQPFIEFDSVSFAYEKERNVLKHVDIRIFPHTKTALVGESGQGKSTLVNLLLRYYEPQKGEIRINGQNISHVTINSLHQYIAVVFQESLLFSGSIMENIRYGKRHASDEEVIEAAKAANAHEFIRHLEKQYESKIGERGVKLSGGQKQRIAIARAILKDAPIIILDEATSSLDSRSELAVQKGLRSLLHNRTSIIIAHRLSTIAGADQIVVLESGTIAESGTSQGLLQKKNGLYAELVALQQRMVAMPEVLDRDALKKYDIVG